MVALVAQEAVAGREGREVRAGPARLEQRARPVPTVRPGEAGQETVEEEGPAATGAQEEGAVTGVQSR